MKDQSTLARATEGKGSKALLKSDIFRDLQVIQCGGSESQVVERDEVEEYHGKNMIDFKFS